MKQLNEKKELKKNCRIIFLHHSTGRIISNGGKSRIRILSRLLMQKTFVSNWFTHYNKLNKTKYKIDEYYFPKSKTYGWNNYPYDYYNIWVKNAGNKDYKKEPTLEILTKKYDLIIFKHCFPVSTILEDINKPDIESSEKRLENYKLQYLALRSKFQEYPNTKFLLWTGPAMVESQTNKEQATAAKSFFDWVKNEWCTQTDNIFIFSILLT